MTQNVQAPRLPLTGRLLCRLLQPPKHACSPHPSLKERALLEPMRKRSPAGAGLALTTSFQAVSQSCAARHESHQPRVATYTEPN